MSNLTNLKKSRSANRNAAKGLAQKAIDKMETEYSDDVRLDLEVLLRAIKAKESLLLKLDGEVLNLLQEEDIEGDVDEATDCSLKISTNITKIEEFLAKKKKSTDVRANTSDSGASASAGRRSGVKTPKIQIKKFNGDPTQWLQFIEIYEATIHKNTDLSTIEKFAHLKSFLVGPAEKCISGLSLTSDNYEEARKLLGERYGNRQLIIASHMDKMLKLERVNLNRNCKDLRNLYDHIESHLRSLSTLGVISDHYGPLLIPVILEKLPDEIKLEASRKLGTSSWNIKEFMAIVQEEVTARESCDFMRSKKPNHERDDHFTAETLLTGTKVLVCAFCEQSHYNDKCNVVTDVERRKEIVRKNRLCFKCLRTGHQIRNCKNRSNCFRCKSSSHNTAICEKEVVKRRKEEENPEEESSSLAVTSQTSVLLQTASGIISDNSETRGQQVRILLDPGSQRTYLSERVVNQIKLKPISTKKITVKTFGSDNGKTQVSNEYEFCLKNPKRGCNMYIKGFSVPIICSPLTNQRVDIAENLFPILKDLDLSDAKRGNCEIDILIGADYYWTVIEGGTRRCNDDGLTAINSKLGWVLSGPFNRNAEIVQQFVVTSDEIEVEIDVAQHESEGLDELVEKFWSLDTLGISMNEPSVHDKFLENAKFVNGRYEVLLPFKKDHPFIEDNYALCEKRLLSLKRKLDKDEGLLRRYDDIIKKQIEAGVVERADNVPSVGEVTYLPHRVVIREEKKTTKERVVFDASAKNKGPSLNESLYKGPCLTPLLFDVFLRFRAGNVGLTADIEKAYLQISVDPSHRDFLRFLWFDDIFKEEPVIIKNRFARVIFGATCSQFLMNAVVKLHSEKYKEIDENFAKMVARYFYSDDLNSSLKSTEEAMEFFKKVKLRFLEGNLNVRKWRTNDDVLRSYTHEQDTEEAMLDQMGDKVLGITWREDQDNLVMDVKSYVEKASLYTPTKRNVLKIIAGFYDPLGFIQPIIVQLKLLFQKICVSKCGWDDTLSEDLKQRWIAMIVEIQNVPELIIQRAYCYDRIDNPVIQVEMHGFSDASMMAFGACIYNKFIKKNGSISVSFVASKSQVVSINNNKTIHRLELLGAFMLSNLILNVSRALETEILINRIFCWTDSQVALGWIKAVDNEYKTFVQNRVSAIRENVDVEKWFYCRSEANPADLITRNVCKADLNTWLKGPEFLHVSQTIEHEVLCDTQPPEFYVEIKPSNHVLLTMSQEDHYVGNIININKYNDILRLLRITAYVLRFVAIMKSKSNKQPLKFKRYLKANEINDARRFWILDNQKALQLDDTSRKQLVLNLSLQKDDSGIIRSYSRFKNSNLPFKTKAPVFIMRSHRLAELLVHYSHLRVLHRGIRQTLTELRESYWLTRGRSFVKGLLHSCVVCRKLNSRPYDYPLHSDLPAARFDETCPFNSTGTDYLGPLLCMPVYGDDQKLRKAYIAIYTCLSTRAVILEVVHNAAADTFINSFSRFIGRRGCPKTMFSDNGSVYVADATQEFAANRGIEWKFNIDGAPWQGGAWERLVGSVKRCLKKVLGTKKVTYVELQTIVVEVEAVLNNRPIGIDYDDDQDEVLTPNHLLFGRRLPNVNVSAWGEDGVVKEFNFVKRKRFMDVILNHFWQRWRKEHLAFLRESQNIKFKQRGAKIQINDIIIVYEDKQPRHLWQMGRVVKLITGSDGMVRGATVKLAKSGNTINRPTNKLYPILPCAETAREENVVVSNSISKRAAAKVGEHKRRFGDTFK